MCADVVSGLTGWAKSDARIAYDNFLELATVLTPSGEVVDYPVENAVTWFTSDKWKDTAAGTRNITITLDQSRTVDCLGIYKHNLAGATISLQHAPSTGGPWTTLLTFIPGSNNALFRIASAGVASQYWRINMVGCPSAPIVGNLFLGKSLQLYGGIGFDFVPPTLSRDNEVLNQRAEGGEYIGRSIIRRGGKTNIKLPQVPPEWVRDNWEPFIDSAELHPFYFAWNVTTYPEEVAYCYSDGDIPAPRYSNQFHMNVSIPVVALL